MQHEKQKKSFQRQKTAALIHLFILIVVMMCIIYVAAASKFAIPLPDHTQTRLRCSSSDNEAGHRHLSLEFYQIHEHVVHKHLSASLVYTLQCHSYTTSSVTNILSSMSLIYSILCQGYTRSCLRGILTSAYEVFSILCKGYPQRVCLALR